MTYLSNRDFLWVFCFLASFSCLIITSEQSLPFFFLYYNLLISNNFDDSIQVSNYSQTFFNFGYLWSRRGRVNFFVFIQSLRCLVKSLCSLLQRSYHLDSFSPLFSWYYVLHLLIYFSGINTALRHLFEMILFRAQNHQFLIKELNLNFHRVISISASFLSPFPSLYSFFPCFISIFYSLV